MEKRFIWFFLLFPLLLHAQQGFQFKNPQVKKIVIQFELINNLIFIPITVNGVELNFLLDTGVEETILFSLEETNEVSFFDVQKVKLMGLGSEHTIEGLKSSNNILSINNFVDSKHDVYIVLDQSFNFSSQIGIPVNGIIGYHFFRNYPVEINYDKKKLTVYNSTNLPKKHISKFSSADIILENGKPFIIAEVGEKSKKMTDRLLLDMGNSDAVWLFGNKLEEADIPRETFKDFLGRGFSGDIHGQRGRISMFGINGFRFMNPLIAIPDSASIKNISIEKNRIGSVGGEILKRFVVILDFPNNKMHLRKGGNFKLPFNYNMSGIEIHHEGMTWVQEKISLTTERTATSAITVFDDQKKAFNYKFNLKPVYEILSVRENSPADLCGLKKGDIINTINGKPGYKYTLQQINGILKSDEGKVIKLEVQRGNEILHFKFRLKSLL